MRARRLIALVALALPVVVPGSATASNEIQRENARPGTAWAKPDAGTANIDIFQTEPSVAPGETLHFHVAGSADARYRVEIYRSGWYGGIGARRIECLPGCTTDEPLRPPTASSTDPTTLETKAGWPITDSVPVTTAWTSGMYFAEAVITTGPLAGRARMAPFVVRSAPGSTPTAAVIMLPTATWQAMNDWGGASHYTNPPSTHLSWDRPFTRYDWVRWEYPMDRWLEREGYDVSYVSDVDVDRDPGLVAQHRLAIAPGLSEYWSRAMRNAFANDLAEGGNLLFPGGNSVYRQIRFSTDPHAVEVVYITGDPESDPSLQTTFWRDLDPPEPECTLTGEMSQGNTSLTKFVSADYVVTPSGAADPWFRGSGLKAGDHLTDLVGQEFSAPVPGCAPELRQTALLIYDDGNGGVAQAVRSTAPSGGRVFTGGSLQFAFGLDPYRYAGQQAGIPTSSALQHVMANGMQDLLSPAPPHVAVTAQPDGNHVKVGDVDPRVKFVILRHIGASPFSETDPAAVRVCPGRETACVDDPPQTAHYRYLAYAYDRWGGTSQPGLGPGD